jgi:hypothetical protein
MSIYVSSSISSLLLATKNISIYIYVYIYMVGGFKHLEKYESQWEG